MNRSGPRGSVTVAIAFALLLARPAFADDTAECIAASEAAQQLRDDHALLEAREKLIVCSRPACPAPIRKDCLDLGAQVDAAVPTIVLRARDPRGSDVVDVKVYCDGALMATKLDGKALRIDPGAHAFRFEPAGLPVTSRTIVLGEGEKNRLEVVDLVGADVPRSAGVDAGAGAGKETPASARTEEAGVSTASTERSALLLPSLIVGAAGVAALVPMGVMWAIGTTDVHHMRTTCAPSAGGAGCEPSQVDSARTKLIVGDVFLGVAVAGIGTGAILFFLSRGHAQSEAAVRVGGALLPGGGYLSTEARF
jgi:hypothetical protein